VLKISSTNPEKHSFPKHELVIPIGAVTNGGETVWGAGKRVERGGSTGVWQASLKEVLWEKIHT